LGRTPPTTTLHYSAPSYPLLDDLKIIYHQKIRLPPSHFAVSTESQNMAYNPLHDGVLHLHICFFHFVEESSSTRVFEAMVTKPINLS